MVMTSAVSKANHSLKLGDILEQAIPARDNAQIEIREILENFGTSAYGPAIFFLSLVELLPFISAIPGMFIFTSSAMIVLAGQLLMGWPSPWLPGWVLNRRFSRVNLRERLERWKPWTKRMEALVRPRWEFMLAPPFLQCIAVLCIGLALSFYPLAPIPASEKVPAFPIAVFALAITVRDGLLAIIGFVVCGSAMAALIYFWPAVVDAAMKGLAFMGV